jgi:hypothetical protein
VESLTEYLEKIAVYTNEETKSYCWIRAEAIRRHNFPPAAEKGLATEEGELGE